jgi:hypothetical protein
MAAALKPLPHSFASTRDALHRVAERIVAPSRKPHNEIALRQTPGGFGTPEFDFDGLRTQVRVEGAELVLARASRQRRAKLTTLADAAALLGPKLLPDGVPTDSSPLGIEDEPARRLADFYAFAADALQTFRESLPREAAASPINLWPEHFDIAFEVGPEAAGRRANYGASPGDEEHPEPYLYVGPWTAEVDGRLWNATAFNGAELGYVELAGGGNPMAATLDFFRLRHEALSAGA